MPYWLEDRLAKECDMMNDDLKELRAEIDELLEALEGVVSFIENLADNKLPPQYGFEYTLEMTRAYAAIAKARGGE